MCLVTLQGKEKWTVASQVTVVCHSLACPSSTLYVYSYLTYTIQLLLDLQMMRRLQPPSLYLAVWVVEATWAAEVVEFKDQ